MLAVIALLMTPKAKTSALAFLSGWLFGILGIGTIVILLPGVLTIHGELSDTTGIIKTILGLTLLVLIIPLWKRRPKPGEPMPLPRMFKEIDKFGLGKSFVVGFLSTALSIKNFALSASAAAHIDATSLVDYFETFIGLFIFSILASITIIAPIIIYFISPSKMAKLGVDFNAWILKYYTPILITLFFVFGLLLTFLGLRIYLT